MKIIQKRRNPEMRPSKNYIDEKGNYHNIENLTLAQIHDRGVEEGYRIAKQESGINDDDQRTSR